MLWNKEKEKDFFIKSLEFASPEQLFYLSEDNRFYAYWPKGYPGIKSTLQSRNSLIGNYTERWCTDLFKEIASAVNGYPVQGAVCNELGLTNKSPADVAICKTEEVIQKPRNIIMIIEVKMSVVWNWELISKQINKCELICLGDYQTHQGNPGLLRSDTMLKAIGKSINIRISSADASNIPIIVIGNTPITTNYYQKVDHLKQSGIVQGFWSINPEPLTSNGGNIKNTPGKGFCRFDSYEDFKKGSLKLMGEDKEFFSSMQSKRRLGEIIEIANREQTYEAKAQRFLEFLREVKD